MTDEQKSFTRFLTNQQKRVRERLARPSRMARMALENGEITTAGDMERHGRVEHRGIVAHYSGVKQYGQP